MAMERIEAEESIFVWKTKHKIEFNQLTNQQRTRTDLTRRSVRTKTNRFDSPGQRAQFNTIPRDSLRVCSIASNYSNETFSFTFSRSSSLRCVCTVPLSQPACVFVCVFVCVLHTHGQSECVCLIRCCIVCQKSFAKTLPMRSGSADRRHQRAREKGRETARGREARRERAYTIRTDHWHSTIQRTHRTLVVRQQGKPFAGCSLQRCTQAASQFMNEFALLTN